MIGWLFSKKKGITKASVQPPRIDLHSHLIPGIDDGCSTIDESLEILKAMELLGYNKIITTPHVMSDAYQNSTRTILEGLETLRRAAADNGIALEIEAAAEYYMDEELIKRLEHGDILTLGDNYLLFETSYVSKPLNFEEIVFEIQARGYRALFAHPERYRYINDPYIEFKQFKDLGMYLQLDINSLGGFYGRQAKKHALILSEYGIIDFLGSDIHRIKQVEFLGKVFSGEAYGSLLNNNQIMNNTL